MTLLDFRQVFFSLLSPVYTDGRELNSIFYAFMNDVLGISRAGFILKQSAVLSEKDGKKAFSALERLHKGEAFQYITGWQEFCGMRFRVNPSVLIPRSETEEFVHLVLEKEKKHKGLSLLDIGTGSGCIAVSLKAKQAEWQVSALDVSKEALKTAGKNARENKAEIVFLHLDILSHEAEEKLADYDVIVSNPPYVLEREKKRMKSNVLHNEPPHALFVPDSDPLIFYKRIANLAVEKLKRGGRLYFEINSAFGKDTCALLGRLGYKNIELKQDLSGRDRFVSAQL